MNVVKEWLGMDTSKTLKQLNDEYLAKENMYALCSGTGN